MDYIRISSYGGSKNSITFEGLTNDEFEILKGALTNGNFWISGRNGRLVTLPTSAGFPDPVMDLEMQPFWRKPTQEEIEKLSQQILFNDEEQLNGNSSPSIFISSLCGYDYTPENYEHEATQLVSYGFQVMRSQRGLDGKYWEVWYLPGAWAAKGGLKNHLDTEKHKSKDKLGGDEETKTAIDFLKRNCKFGSLDVSVQRLAMVLE